MWYLLKPYWTSEEKWSAFAFLTLKVVFIVIAVRASVALNDFNKDFFDALQAFNKPALMTAMLHFGIILLVLVISYGYDYYFSSLLSLRWRRWLTHQYLNKWLTKHNHYRLQLLTNTIDNPDQRISDDLDRFPDTSLSLFTIFLHSILTLSSFGYILWNLSGDISFTLGGKLITIPGYLCFGALFFAVFGTWMTGVIGRRLGSLNYQQQAYEADFRFSLVRLRQSGEQVALYKGEQKENTKFQELFGRIFNNNLQLIRVKKYLTFFTNGYDTTAYIIGLLMAIPLYFKKKVQLGSLMQISSAFNYVIMAFSALVTGFTVLAEWRSVIHRLAEFSRAMSANEEVKTEVAHSTHKHNEIHVHDLCLMLPDGSVLQEKLEFNFACGKAILLCGPSGQGKSTFLRTLAGIWPYARGRVQLPHDASTMFLPQKPYLPLGSLKEVLTYPHAEASDAEVVALLQRVGLEKLLTQVEEIKNWSHELSLGEQQRIAFARVLLHKPNILFLDEASSALDEAAEQAMYEMLQKELPALTIVSVGHRSSLRKFHHEVVYLEKEVEMYADEVLV